MSDKTVRLKIFSSRSEAELAQSLLESNGIPSAVQVDDCGGMRPDIGMTSGGASLFVREKDVEEARQLLSLKGDD